MIKKTQIGGVCLLSATLVLPVSQVAWAEGEVTWDISGWINEGMTYYDDGDGTDLAQLSDNGTTLGSRIVLSGDYKPKEIKLEAGFEVIIEPLSGVQNFAGGGQVTPLLFANQDNLDTFNGGDVGLLGSSVYVGGDWGKVTLGLQSMPTDNIAVLQDPSMTIWSGISPLFRGNGFFIRGLGDVPGVTTDVSTPTTSTPASNNTWGQFAQCLATPGLGIGIDCNGVYRNGIRYDLPAFGSVNIAVGWANDDIFDVALKYADEIAGMKAKLGVGYSHNSDGGSNVGANDSDTFQIQGGLMDPETGLFGVATYQYEEADKAVAGSGDETDAYYFKFGIRKQFINAGDSAFYGEYASYNDQYGSGAAGISGSNFERWGLVAEQYIGKQLIIYGKWEQYMLDVDGTPAIEAAYDGVEDLNLVTLGLTFFF